FQRCTFTEDTRMQPVVEWTNCSSARISPSSDIPYSAEEDYLKELEKNCEL
ncbi:hypothetical protein AVEN_263544-1, partial [Araneus ventricosus]